MQGFKDYWIDNKQSHFHAAYDPATRTTLALHLEKEETTHGYYKMLETLLLEGKTPEMFKGVCHSSFVINKKDVGTLAHKDVNTQFGFTLELLGVKMENSSEPTFKGAIERSSKAIAKSIKRWI